MEDKTKQQLIEQIESLHKELANLKQEEAKRKQAEEALLESEKFSSSLLSNSPNPILVTNRDTSVRYVNPALEELTGFSPSELVGMKPPYPWWTEETLQKTSEDFREALRKGIQKAERLFQKKDGQRFWVEVSATPAKQNGELKYYIVAWVDITERKRAEEELQESQELLQTLFDSILDGILILDYSGEILSHNSILGKMIGLESTGEAVGRNALEFVLPEFHSVVIQDLANVKEGRGGYLNSYKVRSATEREFWIEGLGTDIIYKGKHADLVSIRDITERRRAQEQLERSFAYLAETVSRAMSSRDPYTTDHQQRVAELARLVGEKMGLDKHRLEGLHIGALLHDIGKISIPGSILNKPGKLTEEEWALIRAHTKQGYEILDGGRFPWPVADMALHHHERLNGSGYPDGISGDKLGLECRILSVCDVVEAMSSHRPYRPARSREEILEELKSGRETKYDASVVDIVLQIIESGEFELN
ncbi:MAG: PAS domain S-box protein [Dehalococcoidia bacterium]|nr:PAS domain S-box protein [Dehalococcoidia bacterium]